jgi:hypothetical protein
MIAAAIATMATVDAARIMWFVSQSPPVPVRMRAKQSSVPPSRREPLVDAEAFPARLP